MGFVRPHLLVLVGALFSLTALIFHIVGMAAPGWFFVHLGEKGKAMVGLWRYCFEEPKEDCEDIDTQWPVNAWLEATRAFSVLGLLALLLCAASCFVMCFLSQVRIFFSVAPLSALAAALMLFIEFSAFAGGVERRKNTWGQDFAYHYCFGLTIAAFIFSLIATVCFLLVCKGKSNLPPDSDGFVQC